VVLCAGLGMYLMAMDIAVNVALPTITSHFHTDIRTIQWIIISYVATRAGLAVGAGSFGDLFGLRRVFLVGVLLNGVSLALIAFSPNLGLVFGLRVLQGVGAGGIYAVAPAIAGRVFSSDRRGIAMGVTTAGWAVGTVSGSVGMGYLVHVFGWEAAFLGRVPFCVAALALGWVVLPSQAPSAERPSFDLAGAISLVGCMVSLVLALYLGGRSGWGSPMPVAFLAAFPVFLVTFVYWERRARWPVLDLDLLRLPSFLAACSSLFFVQLGAFVIWFIFPFYMAEGLGRGPTALGLVMAAMASSMSLAAPVAGWLSDRAHPGYVGLAGAVAVALGLAWMANLGQGASLTFDVGVRIAVVGLGLGSLQAAVYSLMLKTLPAGQLGAGSGSLSLSQAMGSVVSVALGGFFFALRSDHHASALAATGLTPEAVEVESLIMAFHDTFRVAVVAVLLGIPALALSSGWVARRAMKGWGRPPL
jgi:MFS family permease